MKTRFPKPKRHKHQELMNDLNNMMIRIKVHLFELNDLKTGDKISTKTHLKPTIKEIDELQRKIVEVLEKDKESFVLFKLNES